MEAEQEERVKERQRRKGREGREERLLCLCTFSPKHTHTVTTEGVCVQSQTFDTTT